MSPSSSVCQGLQSCLEPHLIEPRVLSLKLATAKPNSPPSSGWLERPSAPEPAPVEKIIDNKLKNSINEESHTFSGCDSIQDDQNNGEMRGGWSFIQALVNTPHRSPCDVTENSDVYVHPLVKSSSSKLSWKSLEMCTESLGCETGSDISSDVSESSDESSLSLEDLRSEQPRMGEISGAKKVKRNSSSRGFPPPLTSISGSTGSIQVRPQRESGRLVLKAVTITESRNFHAERSNGRLRLSLVSVGCDDSESEPSEEEKNEEEISGVQTEVGEDHICVNDGGDEEDDDDDDDDKSECACWDEEMEGNCGKVGGELGTGKLQRPSRCGSGNWDHFWGLPTAPLQKPISQF